MFGPQFPYFSMQQLNLDWLMDYLKDIGSVCVPIVKLDMPEENTTIALLQYLGQHKDDVPVGISLITFGTEADAHSLACLFFRMSSDSGIGPFLGFDPFRGKQLMLQNGAWVITT